MTEATRTALERVARILHEAGWDQPETREERPLTVDLAKLRHIYQTLLRQDHVEILRVILQEGTTVKQASERMGLTEDEAKGLFFEALCRLRDFSEETIDIAPDVGDGEVTERTPRSSGTNR